MALASSEPERLERRPMSRARFEALPEGVRAEYVRGVAVVTPPASLGHNLVAARLMALLQEALPGLLVAHEVGVRLHDSLRIPDIAAVARFDDEAWQTQAPVLVVEILSRGTRVEDTLRKPGEYLEAGVQHCWLVDRDAGTITVLAAGPNEWAIVHELDDVDPVAEVALGPHGTVTLDVRTVVPEDLRG